MTWTSIAAPPATIAAAVAASNGLIYLHHFTTGGFSSYNPVTDTHTTGLAAPSGSPISGVMVDDPADNSLWLFGEGATRKYNIAGDSWSSSFANDPDDDTGRDLFACGRRGRTAISAGGYATAELDTTSLYDLDGDTWSAGAVLPFPVAEIQGAWVGHLFYVFGAFTDDGFVYAPVGYVYNVVLDTWTEITGVPYNTDVAGSPFVGKLPGGQLLVAGGYGDAPTADAWLYDSRTDTWEQTTDAPFTGYKTGAVVNGIAYVWAASGSAAGATFTPDTLPETYSGLSVITAELVAADDLVTPLAILELTKSREWQDPVSDFGNGSITFQNDDPALALVAAPNSAINFYLYGAGPFFTMLCKNARANLIATDEEPDETTTWTGPGVGAVTGRAAIYPSGGVDRLPIQEDRNFNYVDESFDDSAWGAATNISTVLNAKTAWDAAVPEVQWDADFPDGAGAVQIVGPADGTVSTAGVGDHYLRDDTIDIPSDGTYTLVAGADNYGEVFIDGQLELTPGQSDSLEVGFTHYSKITLEFTTGLHLFAGKLTNAPGAGSNPTGMAAALFASDALGNLGALIWYTAAATTKILEYQAEPPGMTAGKAILVARAESIARGGLAFDVSFNETTDSNGVAWPTEADIATKVGTKIATFLLELAATYIDFSFTPGTTILNTYIRGTLGEGTAVSFHAPTDQNDESTGNLSEHHTIREG